MRFENKLILVFLVVIVLSLSIINFVSVSFYRHALEDAIKISAKYILYSNMTPPDFLVISPRPINGDDLSIVSYSENRYVYVKKEYIRDRVRSHALTLFIWESVLTLVLTYIFYLLVIRNVKKEKEREEFIEVLLLSITHRIGNFISVLKVNLELLEPINERVLNRIQSSVDSMEHDYARTVEILKALKETRYLSKERIDLSELVRSLVINNYDGRIKLSVGKSVHVVANRSYLEILISQLLDNALKYSERFVHLKLCSHKGRAYLFIRNDVSRSKTYKGSGLGLKIADYIAKNIGANLGTRVKGRFLVYIAL